MSMAASGRLGEAAAAALAAQADEVKDRFQHFAA